MVIELHGANAMRIVTDALKPYTKDSFTYGELTIYQTPRLVDEE